MADKRKITLKDANSNNIYPKVYVGDLVDEQGNDASLATSAQLTAHTSNTSNPHSVTAAQIGALPSGGATLTGDFELEAANIELTASGNITINEHAVPSGTSPFATQDYVSGTNDGTNWQTITIGSTTKNIPAGGGGTPATYLKNAVIEYDNVLKITKQDDTTLDVSVPPTPQGSDLGKYLKVGSSGIMWTTVPAAQGTQLYQHDIATIDQTQELTVFRIVNNSITPITNVSGIRTAISFFGIASTAIAGKWYKVISCDLDENNTYLYVKYDAYVNNVLTPIGSVYKKVAYSTVFTDSVSAL